MLIMPYLILYYNKDQLDILAVEGMTVAQAIEEIQDIPVVLDLLDSLVVEDLTAVKDIGVVLAILVVLVTQEVPEM